MQVIEKQVFLRRSAKLPQELRINGSIVDADWLTLSDDADALVQRVWDADWHFFHLTEEVKGSALAISKEAAADAALCQALKRVQASRNTAEVVSVRYRSLFGMHFCQVHLAAWHIQFGPILHLAPSVGLLSPACTRERASGFPVFSEEVAA